MSPARPPPWWGGDKQRPSPGGWRGRRHLDGGPGGRPRAPRPRDRHGRRRAQQRPADPLGRRPAGGRRRPGRGRSRTPPLRRDQLADRELSYPAAGRPQGGRARLEPAGADGTRRHRHAHRVGHDADRRVVRRERPGGRRGGHFHPGRGAAAAVVARARPDRPHRAAPADPRDRAAAAAAAAPPARAAHAPRPAHDSRLRHGCRAAGAPRRRRRGDLPAPVPRAVAARTGGRCAGRPRAVGPRCGAGAAARASSS